MLTMDSKKIVIKTGEEIELIRESALLVSKTLGLIAKEIKPGSNSLKLLSMNILFVVHHQF